MTTSTEDPSRIGQAADEREEARRRAIAGASVAGKAAAAPGRLEPGPAHSVGCVDRDSTEHHTFIDRLAGHLEAGTARPVIAARFPLETAIDAVRRMEQGDTGGKTTIVFDGGQPH